MTNSESASSSKQPAATPTGDPFLLTPGPLTTSPSVKQSMLHDYGSRDNHFIDLNARILSRLVNLIGDPHGYVVVPLQGSGTFVVEAMLGCFVPPTGKLLVCVNGAYGQRMVQMCSYLKRAHVVLSAPEDKPVDVNKLQSILESDAAITHVAAVHCETTSGILNPIEEIAHIVASQQRSLLIDSMSALGALPLNANDIPFDAVVASSNKCLQGVPGVGFCIARETELTAAKGNAHSLSLDLYDQWSSMKKTKQWRFTPPVQVLLAFSKALDEFEVHGGVAGRYKRYRRNCYVLVRGMREMGFKTLLPDELQAPIIVTFHMPRSQRFDFDTFYNRLREQGYVIYPGKLTVADSFRIGCIGDLGEEEINGALDAIRSAIEFFGMSKKDI